MALHQLAGRQLVRVQLGDAAVALRVIVQRVDHDLARQRLCRDLLVGAQRDGHHHQVPSLGGLGGSGRTGAGAEFGDEIGEGLGAAGVAQDDVQACGDSKAGQGAADVATADEAGAPASTCSSTRGAASTSTSRPASTTVGTAANQWRNTACACQLFTFQSAGGGAWTIKNVNSNLDLAIRDSSSAAGAAVVQNTASSADSQRWTLTDGGNGYYGLRNVNSALVAGVAQSSTADGAAVVQWGDAEPDDQLWKIVRIN